MGRGYSIRRGAGVIAAAVHDGGRSIAAYSCEPFNEAELITDD